MADHRQDYSPARMLINGQRMMGDYTADDAVVDYMRLHPDADESQVRAEIEQVAG